MMACPVLVLWAVPFGWVHVEAWEVLVSLSPEVADDGYRSHRLAFCHWLSLALICLFGLGLEAFFFFASSNTLIQAMIEDDERGRV